ncbi:diguanylate phosphodiesterase, partial [Vibrio sp. 1403]|nr:diguanylate phosphodiesterase [Vibrio sp. 1403]
AEGIKAEVTLQVMRQYGIDLCQGFYIGSPMPLEEINILNERYE